jgi:monoamine oxidase
MRTLRRLYGEDIPEPTAYQITRWAADPFSGGSYSFTAVGATPQMRNDLGANLNGVLYFAGEATSVDHYATAHGAYQSGIQVAEEILRRQIRFAD